MCINGKEYPEHVYLQAVKQAYRDPRVEEEFHKIRTKYVERWCMYFLCKERQENGLADIRQE